MRRGRGKTIRRIALIALALFAAAVLIWRDSIRTVVRDIRHSPTKPIPQGGLDAARFFQQHDRILKLKSHGPFDVIFLGDSITEFWLDPRHRPIFEKHFGHLRTANFGVSSDGTQHVLWRITQGREFDDLAPPELIVLMIGTNNEPTNSPAAIARGVEAIVRTIRARFPTTKLLLLSILPRERGGDEINAKICATNEKLATLADGGRIRYLDLTPSFVDGNAKPAHAMLSDGLHLSVSGYDALAAAIRPTIDDLLVRK